ncbi:MAG: heavy-metal-associated domain-containing protein [Bacteroidales bacterium]|jgi:copper chaperone CopZ|nr:heavy-metal-associated domain-containing protein [Bacteroidales bacterium]
MKKLAIFVCALALVAFATSSKPKMVKRTVVYGSTVECKNCEKKVLENIGFEKGVKDVSVDLSEQTVKIVFDEAKTDTTTLAKAIRKLGYEAKVIKFE